MRIDPLRDLGGRLLDVEKPARYLGGEYGSVSKEGEGRLSIALCFPDLYEIGMSNNAIRILYNGLNRLESVRCERVFAPAPDFEALLKELGLPLYTLESGMPLREADLLGFSIGYELAATSVLAVLSAGEIPLDSRERGEDDPIVIAGGPAISNPHPLARFLDAAYIGEAEGAFFALAEELARMKAAGAGRQDLLERLSRESAVWTPDRGEAGALTAGAGATSDGRPHRTSRAIFASFPETVYDTATPLPTVKVVQDHGTVEIMRGCPNGCRFCHAGYYYRPQRAKGFGVIEEEVRRLVREGGHREITLSSLSSGDYPQLPELLSRLNAAWSPRRVSFQLPSLKVNSFTLPLIAQLAEVRKSGLTFAIETPTEAWQRLINKEVSFERTIAILEEARSRGFRLAKFYFMIGLPVPGHGIGEAEAIVEFLGRLFERTKMQLNVNVGTFVPKPHTPFQWSAQLSEADSLAAINVLRDGLRRYRNIKLSYHSPFVSQLEGVLSRGDDRVGELILEAFEKGARLDAWDEHFDRELWRSVLDGADWDVIGSICGEKAIGDALPWDDIGIRVPKTVLAEERRKAFAFETTDGCASNCNHPCGSCSDTVGVVLNTAHEEVASLPKEPPSSTSRESIGRIVFSYRKVGVASFYQHLAILDSFFRAFLMSGQAVAYSEGFNPMPRLETVQPLPIGFASEAEIASVLMHSPCEPDAFVKAMNGKMPRGISLQTAVWFPVEQGVKQRSIGSLSWGSVYRIEGGDDALASRLGTALEGIGLIDALDDTSPGTSLRLRLPNPKSKEEGLVHILESCVERRPVQASLRIVREQCLATLDGNVLSFFDAYEQVSRKMK